jgi:predicted dehydrogenase
MMTTDLEKGNELVQIAEEKGLYLGVAPDTILGAGLQTAKYVLEKGLIGDVTSCHVSINRNQSLNSEIYRFLRNAGGTLPFDVGIYYVGALLSLLGPVESLVAMGAPAEQHEAQLLYANEYGDRWQIPGSNVMCGLLKFVSGVTGSVHFDGNTVNSEQSTMVIYGTKGILKLGDPNTFDGFVKLCLPENEECDLPLTHGYNGKNTLEPSPFDFYGHRGIGVAEMAWAIRKNRKNRCSKEYGLHCMEVLCGMEKSSETGERFYPQSRFEMKLLTPGYYSTISGGRGDAELSLVD